jgi:putative ABC transport system permease protein
MNIMIMSVYERTKEIGTIMAIGTIPSKIQMLFLSEGLLLGIISTILGLILGVLTVFILNFLNIQYQAGPINMLLRMEITVMEIIITILIVIVVSALASLQPATKASKMEPVDALGHV